MEYNRNGYSIQQVYTAIIQDFNAANLAHAVYVGYQYIDPIVEREIQYIKENCCREEEEYVEKLLREKPLVIERRNNNKQTDYQSTQASSEDDIVDIVNITTSTKKSNNTFLQQQRAEACRRSRLNNKIKKTKLKYRHEYISKKLEQNTRMFNCIRDLIDDTEQYLLSQGISLQDIQLLRQNYGMNKAIYEVCKLKDIVKAQN